MNLEDLSVKGLETDLGCALLWKITKATGAGHHQGYVIDIYSLSDTTFPLIFILCILYFFINSLCD
jgi:hypothetical protein